MGPPFQGGLMIPPVYWWYSFTKIEEALPNISKKILPDKIILQSNSANFKDIISIADKKNMALISKTYVLLTTT
jgi:hypothetical protein